MTSAPGQATVTELCGALDSYREARQEMLRVLGIDVSNRDPLPEWSERIVTALTGGRLAANRNEPGHDLVMQDGRRVQVRSLSNQGSAWVNEHHIRTLPGADWYALVLFEAFSLTSVLLFPADLSQICNALGKRHPDQQTTLQFTALNWQAIRDHPDRFRDLGMSVWLPPLSN